jgi:ATP-dependent helicase HrpB
VRLGASIDPAWLLDVFPENVSERNELIWNRNAERVESRSALLYEALPIEETMGAPADPEQAARMLATRALEAGLSRLADPDEIEQYLARRDFAAEHGGPPAPAGDGVAAAVEHLSVGLRSIAELESLTRNGGLQRAIERDLTSVERKLLDQIAPERFSLGRRQTRIQYARGQAPWIGSRMQDFFGMRQTPTVANGRVRLVLHLLAPSGRPVQVTNDLEGFWTRLYPQVRKELMRRYPKHQWPESPV